MNLRIKPIIMSHYCNNDYNIIILLLFILFIILLFYFHFRLI